MAKIIAKRENAEVFLIQTTKTKGFVADFDQGQRFPSFDWRSIVARGYWETIENDPAVLKRARALPQAA